MAEIEFSYIWDTLKIFLAVFLGWSISRLNDFRKDRKTRIEFNNNFLDLFNAFKTSSILKIFRLIKSIGMEKVEKVFDAVGAIWYDPTRKQISSSRSGFAGN